MRANPPPAEDNPLREVAEKIDIRFQGWLLDGTREPGFDLVNAIHAALLAARRGALEEVANAAHACGNKACEDGFVDHMLLYRRFGVLISNLLEAP